MSDKKPHSGSTADFPPPAYPMGIIADYTRHTTPICLRIRERKSSFTGDEFHIKDALTSSTVFEVKAMSWHQKKTLLDHTGKALFEFAISGVSLMTAYVGKSLSSPDGQNKELFHIKTKGKLKPKLEVKFNNLAGDGKEQLWELRGKWFSGSSELITQNKTIVAKVERDYKNTGEILFGKQTYMVTIAPGVDASLISAICICLDESYNDSNG